MIVELGNIFLWNGVSKLLFALSIYFYPNFLESVFYSDRTNVVMPGFFFASALVAISVSSFQMRHGRIRSVRRPLLFAIEKCCPLPHC